MPLVTLRPHHNKAFITFILEHIRVKPVCSTTGRRQLVVCERGVGIKEGVFISGDFGKVVLLTEVVVVIIDTAEAELSKKVGSGRIQRVCV